MRNVTITLPDTIAHRLEIRAAIDDMTLADGIALLLIHMVNNRFKSCSCEVPCGD